jgi:hypothetical protein
MKILFLGPIGFGQTSLMRLRTFERLGHTVEPWPRASWLKRQLQRRLQHGSLVDEINRAVLERARELWPNLVWAEKQEFLYAETIEELRKLNTRCCSLYTGPIFLARRRKPNSIAVMSLPGRESQRRLQTL